MNWIDREREFSDISKICKETFGNHEEMIKILRRIENQKWKSISTKSEKSDKMTRKSINIEKDMN